MVVRSNSRFVRRELDGCDKQFSLRRKGFGLDGLIDTHGVRSYLPFGCSYTTSPVCFEGACGQASLEAEALAAMHSERSGCNGIPLRALVHTVCSFQSMRGK